MTGKWLVCLSLLVIADAASLGPKPIEIPVQVVYDEVPQKAIDHEAGIGLKNLEEKPQLSIEEIVEEKVLNIPIAIAKIAESAVKDVLQNTEERIEENSSSSEGSSSEESNENKSVEDSREDESNEIHNEILQPVEEIIVPAVPAIPVVPVDLPVIQNEMVEPIVSDPVQPAQPEQPEQAVVVEMKVPEKIVANEQPDEIMIAQEDAPLQTEVVEDVKVVEPQQIIIETVVADDSESKPVVPEIAVPVQEVSDNSQLRVGKPESEENPKQEAPAPQNAIPQNPTTAAPFRPLAGLQSAINRLGENIGNVINIIRPPSNNNEATTKAPIIAPVEPTNPADIPIRVDSPAPEAPAQPAPPNFVNSLQTNINNQLSNFGNRVNSFIDNLRPKAPANAQNEEETTAPNTPFINGMQNQFNNGLQSLTQTVNSAFGFINPNGPNVTKEDEAGQQQNQNQFPAVQQILNGVTSFQQNFQNFINGNQPSQQGDEGTPSESNNLGQQVLQMVTSNIQNIFQPFNRPNNGTQGDEAPQNQNPLTGIQNIFSNIGSQFNNFISGGQPNSTVSQNIPSQIPAASQIPGIPQLGQIPGAPQLPQIPGAPQLPQIPGAPQLPQIPGIDNLAAQIPAAPQIPGAEQFQQGLSQIPGASQFQQGLGQIPGAEQIQQGLSQIPGAGQLPALPGIPQSPGASPSEAPAPPAVAPVAA